MVALFAQNNGTGANANDVRQSIINSLLIQQLIQSQQNQNAQQPQTTAPVQQEPEKKKAIRTVEDLHEAGFTRIKMDKDAEDYLVINNWTGDEVELDIWVVGKGKKETLSHIGKIFVRPGDEGYKKNPLDHDLDRYSALFLKADSDNIVIEDGGEKHSDQYINLR